ncbi:GNAT family N-acetyltransferase [Demequina phytophila]|uniref:GNAT family N-acetyltransferase n=1 Tax=Demequina phytophila TaxID=1638981 RepID=UPI000784FB06|nr:GNAT family N-acetyltransferase [Demequina phytophila]
MSVAAGDGPEALGIDLAQAMDLCEVVEARSMWGTVAMSPRETRRALGIRAARIGSGIALATAHDPTGGHWNKALAHGLTEPVDDALIAELVAFYRASGAPAAAIQIAPALLPEDWEDIAARHGLAGGSTVVKMLRHRRTPVAPAATELDLRGVDARGAHEWAATFLTGFGMPTQPDLVDMIASTVGRDFYAYGAWDGEALVGAACVFIGGDAAQLAGASTLPAARGRGAQSALLSERITAATDAGCVWIAGETGAEKDGEHNPSLHNMLRAGFVPMYERRNWVWRRPA